MVSIPPLSAGPTAGSPAPLASSAPSTTAGATEVGAAAAPAAPTAPVDASAAAPVQSTEDPAAIQAALLAQLRQAAAARPGGLAPLLADLAQAVDSEIVPPPVQNAAGQILAINLPAETPPTAEDIRTAFAQAGPATESRLAAAADGQAALPATADLKTLLLTLRQTLRDWVQTLPDADPVSAPLPTGASAASPSVALPSSAAVVPSAISAAISAATSAATSTAAPSAAPIIPGALVAAVATPADPAAPAPTSAASGAAPSVPSPPDSSAPAVSATAPSGTPAPAIDPQILTILSAELTTPVWQLGGGAPIQMTAPTLALLQAMGLIKPADTASTEAGSDAAPDAAAGPDDAADPVDAGSRPPVKGGPTTAQAPARSALPSGGAASLGRHLLEDSEAALAHQKLLQVASLPEPSRPTQTWMFEIPIATAQGTAVAQFAIDKDGGEDADKGQKEAVWRARFSVNLEPLGPVHAGIALSAGKTWVTLWADRRASLLALKADAEALAGDLAEADLAAEIAFRPVLAPKQGAVASGHFVDHLS